MSEIFAVHAIRPAEVRPTELLCTSLAKAERYATELSTDPGVLAAGITRFVVDELGTRRTIALYVAGGGCSFLWVKQISTIRIIPGQGHHPSRRHPKNP